MKQSVVIQGLIEIIDGDEKLRKAMLRNLGFMNAELLADQTEAERILSLQGCITQMIDLIGKQSERAAITLDRLRH